MKQKSIAIKIIAITLKLLAIVLSFKKHKIAGFKVKTKPNVFPPRFTISNEVFYDFLSKVKRSFNLGVDIGCGSGILSLILASKCKHVIATDISLPAVKVSYENAKLNDILDKICIVACDVASALKNNVADIVVANPPFFKGRARTSIEKAIFHNREFIRKLASDTWRILKTGGLLYIILSTLGSYREYIRELIRRGFKVRLKRVRRGFYGEIIMLVEAEKVS